MDKNTSISESSDDKKANFKDETIIRKHFVRDDDCAIEISCTTNELAGSTVSVEFKPDCISSRLSLEHVFDLCALLGAMSVNCKLDLHDIGEHKVVNVGWEADGSVLFKCHDALDVQVESYNVVVRNKMDRMSIFNVCLYALSRELHITPGEVMMQLATMNRTPAPDEIWKDKIRRENKLQKNHPEVQH